VALAAALAGFLAMQTVEGVATQLGQAVAAAVAVAVRQGAAVALAATATEAATAEMAATPDSRSEVSGGMEARAAMPSRPQTVVAVVVAVKAAPVWVLVEPAALAGVAALAVPALGW